MLIEQKKRQKENLLFQIVFVIYSTLIIFSYIYPLLTANFAWSLLSIISVMLCVISLIKKYKLHINKQISLWFLTLFPILINSYSIKVHEYGYTLIWILLLLLMILAQDYTSWGVKCFKLIMYMCLIYASSTILINIGITEGIQQIALLFRNSIQQGSFKTAGLTAHYSHNGMYIAIGSILAGSFFFGKNKKKRYLFLFILFLIALLLTQKRGPLIAVIISVFITYFFSFQESFSKKSIRIIGGILAMILSIYIFYELFPSLFSVLDRFSTNDNMLTNRQYLWDYALKMFTSNPVIGHGWGSFSHSIAIKNDVGVISNQHAHNIYLQLLAESGLIGLICFLIPMIVTLYNSLGLLKRIDKKQIGDVSMFASTSLQLFFIIYGLSGNPLYDKQMFIPYMIAVTIYISYYRNMYFSNRV